MATESVELAKLAGRTLKKLDKVKQDTVSGDDPATDQMVILLEAFGVVSDMVEERMASEHKLERPG